MNYQQELDSQELAWRLIKDDPYKAMEYLEYDEDGLRELFGALNEALEGRFNLSFGDKTTYLKK